MQDKKIMVIDPLDIARNKIKHAIQMQNIKLIEASNAQEARQNLLKDKSIKLIFLELDLPDTDGLDLVREIRAKKHAKDLKICCLSNIRDKTIISQAITLGADDYVLKPASNDTISNKVSQLLNYPYIEQFAYINVSFDAKLMNNIVQPNLQISSLSEDGLIIRSTAAFIEGAKCEIESPKFSNFIKNDMKLILRVDKCKKIKKGVFILKAHFIAIDDTTLKHIRSVAIQGRMKSHYSEKEMTL